MSATLTDRNRMMVSTRLSGDRSTLGDLHECATEGEALALVARVAKEAAARGRLGVVSFHVHSHVHEGEEFRRQLFSGTICFPRPVRAAEGSNQ